MHCQVSPTQGEVLAERLAVTLPETELDAASEGEALPLPATLGVGEALPLPAAEAVAAALPLGEALPLAVSVPSQMQKPLLGAPQETRQQGLGQLV